MRHSKEKCLDELQTAHGENKIPRKARRQLRQLLVTAAVGGAMIAAPQLAKAATHTLSGAQTTPQAVVTDSDPTVLVNTDPSFSVNTTIGNALTIQGAGDLSYLDANSSTLSTTNGVGVGLSVIATGDNSGTPGAITINTGGAITGGNFGISTLNQGSGTTSITTTGQITGIGNAGIGVINEVNTTGLTLNATDVSGGTDGINVNNQGTGNISVTTTGDVTGTNSNGILVLALNNAVGDLTINANNASGMNSGIVAENHGTGNTSVTATGTVTGTNNTGILVNNTNAASGNLTVDAVDATGGTNGINVTNLGNGTTRITATGNVIGTNNFGILALALNSSADDLTVEVNNVTGGVRGISTENHGAGLTSITTNGTVEGGDAGVFAFSTGTQTTNITVTNDSEVRNSSQNPTDLALQIVGNTGGSTNITNNGLVTGIASLNNEDDTFNNNGTWNSAGGTSIFSNGTDVLNNSSIFIAANSIGPTTTIINGIETVDNSGDIVMQNTDSRIGGGTAYVGDSTIFTNGGSGVFIANGGVLSVDTDIVPQISDELIVDNVTTGANGPTGVDVNIVNGLGQPTTGDGVPIVIVNGTSSTDAFVLDHPVTGGLYDYELIKVGDPTWNLVSELRPEAVATGVLPILGSRTALSTLSNLHDRQRDENTLSNDDESRKGVWGRVFGQSNDFNANDANDFGFNSRVWGVQAGLDLMASGDNLGNRKYAGLYVAYASASGDARQFDNKVANLDLNATTIGAYYTKYSSDNWYLDLVAQYSSLGGIHAKTATDNVSPGGKSYALSLEAGKQFHPDSRIVREVQAQLIDQYTDMDNVTLNDGTHVNVSGLNAVTGRFGLRLYGNPKGGKSFLPWFRANIWHTFSGDSTISSLGSSIDTPIGGTSGELELGFTKGNAQSGGWGFYGSAGYLFDIAGAEYSGWKGTLGLRKGW